MNFPFFPPYFILAEVYFLIKIVLRKYFEIQFILNSTLYEKFGNKIDDMENKMDDS